MEPSELTPTERGIDFMIHYRTRPFTLHDLCHRYGISYRRAQSMKEQIERVVSLEFAGYYERDDYHGGLLRNLWKIVH